MYLTETSAAKRWLRLPGGLLGHRDRFPFVRARGALILPPTSLILRANRPGRASVHIWVCCAVGYDFLKDLEARTAIAEASRSAVFGAIIQAIEEGARRGNASADLDVGRLVVRHPLAKWAIWN
jgi:hypothetical protein